MVYDVSSTDIVLTDLGTGSGKTNISTEIVSTGFEVLPSPRSTIKNEYINLFNPAGGGGRLPHYVDVSGNLNLSTLHTADAPIVMFGYNIDQHMSNVWNPELVKTQPLLASMSGWRDDLEFLSDNGFRICLRMNAAGFTDGAELGNESTAYNGGTPWTHASSIEWFNVASALLNSLTQTCSLNIHYFSPWNEPDLGWSGTVSGDAGFADVYVTTCSGIANDPVLSTIKTGGGDISSPFKWDWVSSIMTSANASGYTPDFYSIHEYNQMPTETIKYKIWHRILQSMLDAGFTQDDANNLELWKSEWNLTFAGAPPLWTQKPNLGNSVGGSYTAGILLEELEDHFSFSSSNTRRQNPFFLNDKTHDEFKMYTGFVEQRTDASAWYSSSTSSYDAESGDYAIFEPNFNLDKIHEFKGRGAGMFTLAGGPNPGALTWKYITSALEDGLIYPLNRLGVRNVYLAKNPSKAQANQDVTRCAVSGDWGTNMLLTTNNTSSIGHLLISNCPNKGASNTTHINIHLQNYSYPWFDNGGLATAIGGGVKATGTTMINNWVTTQTYDLSATLSATEVATYQTNVLDGYALQASDLLLNLKAEKVYGDAIQTEPFSFEIQLPPGLFARTIDEFYYMDSTNNIPLSSVAFRDGYFPIASSLCGGVSGGYPILSAIEEVEGEFSGLQIESVLNNDEVLTSCYSRYKSENVPLFELSAGVLPRKVQVRDSIPYAFISNDRTKITVNLGAYTFMGLKLTFSDIYQEADGVTYSREGTNSVTIN